jgi:hypothetical protein
MFWAFADRTFLKAHFRSESSEYSIIEVCVLCGFPVEFVESLLKQAYHISIDKKETTQMSFEETMTELLEVAAKQVYPTIFR